VFITNDSGEAEFPHPPERLSGNIGTTREVTQIFGEQFFAPVRTGEARLDRYVRNGDPPNRISILSDG
jgi:hypothetical protein